MEQEKARFLPGSATVASIPELSQNEGKLPSGRERKKGLSENSPGTLPPQQLEGDKQHTGRPALFFIAAQFKVNHGVQRKRPCFLDRHRTSYWLQLQPF